MSQKIVSLPWFINEKTDRITKEGIYILWWTNDSIDAAHRVNSPAPLKMRETTVILGWSWSGREVPGGKMNKPMWKDGLWQIAWYNGPTVSKRLIVLVRSDSLTSNWAKFTWSKTSSNEFMALRLSITVADTEVCARCSAAAMSLCIPSKPRQWTPPSER